jgi:tetratricopeptide (TPR) repeat protein
MKRNQLIAVSACLLLLVIIYLFGNTVKPKDENTPVAGQGHAQQQAAPEALNIEEYINGVNAQIADQKTRERIETLQQQRLYKPLIGEYQKLDKPLAVAYYTVKVAETENNKDSYLNSGDYNSMLMQSAPDEKARRYLAGNAIECYQKAVELDTANTDYQIRLAGAYMEEGSQPMQGVQLLLGIVRRDSNNVDAQLMLGRFGLISGQIDKAIARFQKILYLHPQNTEALFMLAQAYDTQGNKDKALELLEKCKKSATDARVKKEIDNVIDNIKRPKASN